MLTPSPLRSPLWQRHRMLFAAASAGVGSAAYQWWLSSFSLASWRSLAASPYLLAYVGVTFAAGAAATHIMDVPDSAHRARVTSAFEALLRAVGIVALCVGAPARTARNTRRSSYARREAQGSRGLLMHPPLRAHRRAGLPAGRRRRCGAVRL